MGTFIYFTEEQKRQANKVDLAEFLRRQGEKLLPSGRDYRLDSDHSVTIRGSEWFDHETQTGGHAIDFVRTHYGMTFPEAVTMLLGGEQGQCYPQAREKTPPSSKTFALPPPNRDMRRVYAYLMKHRHINRDVITHFARAGVLYEDEKYHNVVFVGKDETGTARHAHKRSTNSTGKAFRQNVEGSDPRYSFHHLGRDGSLFVFEAPIDLLTSLHNALATFFMEYGPICSTGTVKKILKKLEENGKLSVDRHPALTGRGKKATFMTEGKGKTVSVRWKR